MPYTMEDFRRDFLKAHLHELPPEVRLKGLSIDELARALSRVQIEGLREKLRQMDDANKSLGK